MNLRLLKQQYNDFMFPFAKRENGVDLLRGIAIFLVVVYHNLYISVFSSTGLWLAINLVIKTALSFSIPTFFLISGYYLAGKTHICLKKHYGRLLKNIFAFIFWSIFTAYIFCAIHGEKLNFKQFLEAAFFSKIRLDKPFLVFLCVFGNERSLPANIIFIS